MLSELIRDYEAVHGVVTGEEIAGQSQRDRGTAAVPRMAARRTG